MSPPSEPIPGADVDLDDDPLAATTTFQPLLAEEPEEAATDPRTYLVWAVLLLLIGLMGWVLWGQLGKDHDVLRGDEHMSKQRYAPALDAYLRSQARSSFFSRPGLTLKIGLAYMRLDQCDRANDFFFQVLQETGKSGELAKKAEQALVRCFTEDIPGPDDPGENTVLVQAKRQVGKKYNALVLELRRNTSGVSAELEKAYQEYKAAYEAYTKAIREALRKLDRSAS